MQVRTGYTDIHDSAKAVEDIIEKIQQDNPKLILFFFSPIYNPVIISDGLKSRYIDSLVVGCTSSSELTSAGFIEKGITAVSISGDDFFAAAGVLQNLDSFSTEKLKECVEKCQSDLHISGETFWQKDTLALTLIDGTSYMEESVISSLAALLPGMSIVGGSASDLRQFSEVGVSIEGEFHKNSAVILLIKPGVNFKVFASHHFLPSDIDVVVTKAGPKKRTIWEIDGLPAKERYAQIIGVESEKLNSQLAVQYPFGYKLDDFYYIRSVMSVESDHLAMASAVNEGTVLTLMKAGDILRDTREIITKVSADMKQGLSMQILFNCLGRYEEMKDKNLCDEVFAVMNVSPLIGFNTFGEQYSSLHINHSLTGVAFG